MRYSCLKIDGVLAWYLTPNTPAGRVGISEVRQVSPDQLAEFMVAKRNLNKESVSELC